MATVGQDLFFDELYDNYTSNTKCIYRWCFCQSSEWVHVDKKVAVTIMQRTFSQLQEAAFRRSLTGEILVPGDHPNEMVLMLNIFKSHLGIASDEHMVKFGTNHALLCPKAQRREGAVALSWRPDNRFLHPKPRLTLKSDSIWGPDWLNEQRKAGNGDAVLKLGGTPFPVHRTIVESFAETFRKEKNSEGWTIDRPASQSTKEAFVEYLYTKQLKKPLSHSAIMELLLLGHELKASHLRADAFTLLDAIAIDLNSNNRVFLLFHNRKELFPELTTLCNWLWEISRTGWLEEFLKPGMDLLDFWMLCLVANHYKGALTEKNKVWNGCSPAQKCQLLQYALESQELTLIKEFYELAKISLKETPESPDRAKLLDLIRQMGLFIMESDLK